MIDGPFELAPGWIRVFGVLQGSSQRGEQEALEFFEATDRHGMGSLTLTATALSGARGSGSSLTPHGS